MPGMTEDELKALTEAYLEDAKSITTIQDEREDALDCYLMEPLGNEEEGRSQVHSSDVSDVIEWILPDLLDIFISNDGVVEFVPRDEEDIEQAQQESDYTRYVFMQQNNGFLISYTWFKDALLQKNGVVKVSWNDEVQEEREEYEELSNTEYEQLLADDDVEIDEHTARAGNEELAEALPDSPIVKEALQIHDVVLTRKSDVSQVTVDSIAPENFLVDRLHNSLDLSDALFTCHQEKKTIADAELDGLPLDKLLNIPTGEDDVNDEKHNRFEDEGGNLELPSLDVDKMTRKVVISECYIKVDFDGDEKTEIRKVVLGGASGANTLLSNEVVDSNPFIAITPNIMTHKFYGRSVADLVVELQKIKTTVFRQTLDSLYLANKPRLKTIENEVNLEDILDPSVGAPLRVTRPESAQYMTVPFVGNHTLPFMSYLDEVREERAGVGKNTNGLDPDALKDQTAFVGAKLLNSSQKRIKLIARIFAEVGFAPLMKKIHELVSKYEKNTRIAELRGKYVEVDPRSWRKRTNMRVLVGIGNGTQDEKLLTLTQVMDLQRQAIEVQGGAVGPLVTTKNVYDTLTEYVKLSGLKTVDTYFTNPETIPPQQEDDSTAQDALALAQLEIVGNQQIEQAKVKQDQVEHEDDIAVKREKIATDAMLTREKLDVEKQKVRVNGQAR